MQSLIQKLKKDWDVDFVDAQLLEKAFTHSSFANEERLPKTANNERLEFLGDAALQLTISEYLYKAYPDQPEGQLSKIRSSIVRAEALADFSKRCEFDKYIKLGRGEEKTGGRGRTAILEDLFEAFLGALFLDQGFEGVKKFLYRMVIPSVDAGDYERVTDYKTALQEALQVKGDAEIDYQLLEATGPAHARSFEVIVSSKGRRLGQGIGKSKKQAEQEAAKNAFEKARIQMKGKGEI